jgi:hypothetical protein
VLILEGSSHRDGGAEGMFAASPSIMQTAWGFAFGPEWRWAPSLMRHKQRAPRKQRNTASGRSAWAPGRSEDLQREELQREMWLPIRGNDMGVQHRDAITAAAAARPVISALVLLHAKMDSTTGYREPARQHRIATCDLRLATCDLRPPEGHCTLRQTLLRLVCPSRAAVPGLSSVPCLSTSRHFHPGAARWLFRGLPASALGFRPRLGLSQRASASKSYGAFHLPIR